MWGATRLGRGQKTAHNYTLHTTACCTHPQTVESVTNTHENNHKFIGSTSESPPPHIAACLCRLSWSPRSLHLAYLPCQTRDLPPTLHLYMCTYMHAPQSKRGSSGASKPTSLGMIALGTDKGSVSVWDLKRGALAHSLGEVSTSRKTSFFLTVIVGNS